MKRRHINYTETVHSQPVTGISAVEPVAGLYRLRLRSGAVYSAIRIWHGQPLDPVTGEEMDRSPRWCALANGEPVMFFDRIWPACTAEPIDRQEYDYLIATYEWGKTNAPDSPQANPHRKVNLLTAPLPF